MLICESCLLCGHALALVPALHLPKKSFCPKCSERISKYYLGSSELWRKSQFLEQPVMTILPYAGWFRQTCLAAKVSNSQTALQGLTELLLQAPFLPAMMHQIEAIVPVPSSLWGRIRGRIDIARYLAEALSSHYSIPLVLLPTSRYYWRFRKRAKDQNKSSAKGFASHLTSTRAIAGLRVLLVDDVVTTGYSFSQVKQMISGGTIECLALFGTSK